MSHDNSRHDVSQDTVAAPVHASQGKSITPPSLPAEKTGHDIRRIILMLATFLGGTVFLGLVFEKYGSDVPDLVLVLLGFIVLCLFLYLI